MSATRAKFPILLDLSDRLVVIIGGGNVAARKAKSVLAGGGSPGSVRVRVVAPEISESIPDEVERVKEFYRLAHLDSATLVFAATDSTETNQAVVHDARSRNILVCRADDQDDGDFIVPAVHQDGAITVAVSTNSPALSAFVRDEIASRIEPSWSALAEEMQVLRPLINTSKLAATRRAEILRSLATRDALRVLQDAGSTALSDWLTAQFPDLGSILHAGSR
jgi:siroheme synthase-like protein